MRHFTCIMIFCALALAACTDPYESIDQGYEYKVISSGNGKKPVYGSSVEFHLRQMYKNGSADSLLGDTRDFMPRVLVLDSTNLPMAYIKALLAAGKADSVVVRISSDSAARQQGRG